MQRLFIVDPSLKDFRGHHHMMTKAATLSAQHCGFSVHWLCSSEFTNALNNDDVAISPTFSASMYAQYMKKKNQPAQKNWLSRIASLRKNTIPKTPEDAFYADFHKALKSHKIGPADRIFMHTSEGASFRAIPRMLLENAPETLPIFHIATPYDPEGVMPNRGQPEEIKDAIAKLNDRGLIGSRFFLYAENRHLAEHLSAIWGATVRPLDVPVYPAESEKLSKAKRYRREALGIDDDTTLIVSLGSARMEKGFYLMPDIVRRTFEFAGSSDYPNTQPSKIKYVLHASPQIVGRDPRILKAIDKLNDFPQGQASLILESLTEEDYQNLLYASDIVIMPYNEKEYRVRGSTVVSEAIAAGKIIVAKTGSYPGKAAQEYGGEAGVLPIDMAKGVLRVISERAERKTRSLDIAEKYVASNGIQTYWRKCLNAEAEAAQARPSLNQATATLS